MTVTIDLPEKTAQELRLQATQHGELFEAYLAERLEAIAGAARQPKTGADLLARWQREGILLRPEDRPTDEYLQEVREAAGRREHL